MELFSIMPLDTDHIDEICEDIRHQYETGVTTMPLFSMTLVPEGNPPIKKAEMKCEQYKYFKEKLDKNGVPNGILVQASIGHGYLLDEMFPFQKYTQLIDGEEIGTCCPYDKNFQAHFRSVMSTLASYKPDVIMVDDDFRLMLRPGRGCACPLHMKEFNKRAGTNLTRADLLYHLSNDTDKTKEYTEIFVQTQHESLLECAKEMRKGIDDVDPAMPCVFCGCGNHRWGNGCEVAAEIAQILAADGQKSIVRLNNGGYTPKGTHYFSEIMHRFAMQAAVIDGKADVLLAETDTCPQNRYSTGAQYLHAHFTGSILEGARGAKHWITRLIDYEPECGKAYRKYLGENSGFYKKLGELCDVATPLGCRVPLNSKPVYYTGKVFAKNTINERGWTSCVLERMGLPFYYSKNSGGAVVMSGDTDKKFDDAQILEILGGTVFLASDTAKNLVERGFEKYLGVKTEEWTGENLSGEILAINGKKTKAQKNSKKLVITGENVREESYVYHLKDGKECVKLFPGVTVFKNELGGTAVVFCGTPKTEFEFYEAFAFLTTSRKKQLTALLEETGNLPVYYTEDAEILLRAFRLPDDKLMCVIFNLGYDVLENIPLATEKCVKNVQILTKDGNLTDCLYLEENGTITVNTESRTLDPVVIVLS